MYNNITIDSLVSTITKKNNLPIIDLKNSVLYAYPTFTKRKNQIEPLLLK